MDASQVIKLKLARLGSYTHPYKSVDSSTYTWQKQLATPHYVPQTKTCSGDLYDPVSLPCTTCGQGAKATISTDSTALVPNVNSHQMGSGTRVYSTEVVGLQQASRAMCATQTPTAIIIPPTYCESNSAAAPYVNPYQPPFDVQYAMKNPGCVLCYKGFETNDVERCQCAAASI
jgi:hypothetical protein